MIPCAAKADLAVRGQNKAVFCRLHKNVGGRYAVNVKKGRERILRYVDENEKET